MERFKYDIAISYKDELKDKVKRIVDFLEADNWNVYFAPNNQDEMVSQKLHSKLYQIYKNDSLLKVLIISDNYLNGEYTALEKRISLKCTQDERDKLLIINYTGKKLPKEFENIVFIDGKKVYEDEIAFMITKRVKQLKKKIKLSTYKYEDDCNQSININNGIILGDNLNGVNITYSKGDKR